MKLAVLADIHANLPALQAVTTHLEAWRPDQVVVAGDVVNRGPRSPECLAFVLDKVQTAGWHVLKGNHEDYVIAQSQPDAPRAGPLYEIYKHTHWTCTRLDGMADLLASWPDFFRLPGPDAGEIRVAHASMLGNTTGIFPAMQAEELSSRIGQPPPAVFCSAHTHWPLITTLHGALIVNAGATGLPFDGDPRASYARLTWQGGCWRGRIVRVEYDRAQMLADYRATGYLTEAGAMAWLVLAEFLFSRSQLFSWMREYFDLVVAGEATVEATVRRQLESQGYWNEVRNLLK